MSDVAAARPGGRSIRLRHLSDAVKARTLRVLVVRTLGIAALFGFEVTVARQLGVAGYGTLSLMLAIAAVIARMAPLGWTNASTRLVSAHVSTRSIGLVKGSLALAYAATALGMFVAASILWLAGDAGFGLGDAALRYVLPLVAGLTLLELQRHILWGLHAGELGEAMNLLLLPALVMAMVLALGIRSPGAAAAVYAAVCCGLILLSAAAIIRRLPTGFGAAVPEYRLREWSLAALAMLVAGVSTEMMTRASVLLLGSLATPQEVGLYQAAARLAVMNLFVMRAMTPVAAPRMSVLYHAGETAALRAMFARLCLLAFAGALPCFLAFVLFPEVILAWFGPEFSDASSILAVLSIGYLASAATGPCATALTMIGRERTFATVAAASLILGIVSTYILIGMAGVVGAAIAAAGTLIATNLVYMLVFLRATAEPRAPAALPD